MVRELLVYHTLPSRQEMALAVQETALAVFEAAKRGHREIVHLLFNTHDHESYNNYVRCCAARYAVKAGSIDVVGQLYAGRNIPENDRERILIEAAENGQTEIFRMLLAGYTSASNYMFTTAMRKAAAKGHRGVVHQLLATGNDSALKDCLDLAIHVASNNGQFKTAALLYSAALELARLSEDPEMSITRAACAGDSEAVGRELQNASWLYRDCALFGAAEKGHLEIVRALDRGQKIPNAVRGHAIERAARNGHLEIVRALYTGSRLIPIEHALLAAAKNRDLNMINLLLTGYEDTNLACLSTAAAALALLNSIGSL